MSALFIAAILGCAFAQDERSAPRGTTFQLPPGPAATAWSKVDASTPVAQPSERVRTFGDPAAWELEATWSSWSDLVRESQSNSAARAELVAAALAQGRDEDAWDHFAALAAHPGTMHALLPAFAPGVPVPRLSELEASAELHLPDGVALAPRLPPLDRPASQRLLGLGRLERRAVTISALHIGGAQLDMRIGIEQDGVQIDIDNVSGAEARCSVRLPQALDFELSNAYLDWEKLPSATEPIEVRLTPGAPTLTLYGRFAPQQVRWPMTLPTRIDERAQRNGFTLVCGPDDDACPRVRGFSVALAKLVGVESVAESLQLGARTSNALATRLDLSPGPDRERKFRALISAAENWALTR